MPTLPGFDFALPGDSLRRPSRGYCSGLPAQREVGPITGCQQRDGSDGPDCDVWGDGIIDYSYGTRIDLDEDDLDEFAGVCGATSIDWDGGGMQSSVARNINCYAGITTDCGVGDGACYDSNCTSLTDFNDWANLVLDNLTFGDRPYEIVTCQDDPAAP